MDNIILPLEQCFHRSQYHLRRGHGLSIGSVGSRPDNTVSNIAFLSSSILHSQNLVRIKTT